MSKERRRTRIEAVLIRSERPGDLAEFYRHGLDLPDPTPRGDDHLGIRVTDPAGPRDVVVVEGRLGVGAGQQRVNPSVAVGALRRLLVAAHATSAVDAVLPLSHDVLVANRAIGPQLGLGMRRPFRLEVAVDAVEKAMDRLFEGAQVGLVAFGAVFHRRRGSRRDERGQQEEPESRGRADRLTLDHHDGAPQMLGGTPPPGKGMSRRGATVPVQSPGLKSKQVTCPEQRSFVLPGGCVFPGRGGLGPVHSSTTRGGYSGLFTGGGGIFRTDALRQASV